MTSRHGLAAGVTTEVLAAAALYRASRDPAHLAHLFAALVRSPRPAVLDGALVAARNALETLARHTLACAQLAGAIEAVQLPTVEVCRTAANDDLDEPSIGDEAEALAASREASTIPPPPDTQRSRVLADGGATVRESDPDDAEVIDRGGRAWR